MCANTERMWQGVARALEHEEWLADPRFATNKERLANKEALWPLLEQAFRTRDAVEWVARLEAEEIPVAIVNTLDRALRDPQVRHRRMVIELQGEDGAHAEVAGNPMKFSDTLAEERNYPPRLGADNSAVLKQVLGLSDAEITELVSLKAILNP